MRSHRVAMAAAACGLVLAAACSSGTIVVRSAGGPQTVRMGAFTQAFDGTLPADPARAAVMQRFREGLVLWGRSQVASRLVAPVRDYVTGQALTDLLGSIRGYKAHDVVPAGTDRLFMTEVTSLQGSQAQISTCDDGSKFRQQNPRTGRVDQALTAQPQQQYISETWQMGLLHGQWDITGVSVVSLPSQAAERCQPGLAATGAPRPPAMPVLLNDMAAAVRDAHSVHVNGTVPHRGTSARVDLSLARSGGSYGQISESGAEVTVLVSGNRAYLRLNAAFLRMQHIPSSACKLACGKYLRVSGQTPGLADFSMSAFVASLTSGMTHTQAGSVTFGGTIVYDGEPVWALQHAQSTALVAARGRPYPLLITELGRGALSFTQWNTARVPAPPPPTQVLNLTQLHTLTT
jgi:hypothetical protein